ncbi:uncharacterized protein LOC134279668 [Saccostrea cucullata]|uniref:uncharacterized protein LOC134279668 n=1 Tax=Saccostrea cuccullata TaxID=36930 RepID=UPI002ED5DBAB
MDKAAVPKESSSGTTLMNHSGASSKSTMILPVYVSHKENPERELVFALLDTQSDTTFILEKTSRALGLAGRPVKLMLSTMYAENKSIDSYPISRHRKLREDGLIWKLIADEILPLTDCEVGLLIGYKCVKALTPRDIIVPSEDGPYELCTSEASRQDNVVFSIRNKIKEVINPEEIVRMLEVDFSENFSSSKHVSYEDRKFLDIRDKGIHKHDGHYEMPLPFREAMPYLSNNRDMAFQRLQSLRIRLEKDAQNNEHYVSFMRELISNGFAERVPKKEIGVDSCQEWYIPHHGVYHPQKSGKLRVVFDCSARYMGQSLNDHLLQGPDMMNMLFGVLCRFRKDPVTFVCDIEQMFHQFKVNVEHRNYLRFLWWDDGNFDKGSYYLPDDYFYVDDGLKSVATPEEAISIIERSKELCSRSGLRLHKFLSNSKEVLESIPAEERAKGLADIDIHHDKLPMERTLGIQWCIQTDAFQFKITLKDRPLTRRGVLSTLSSAFDPLGFIAPFVLVGKQILQEMCRNQTDWDSPLPENLKPRWRCWRNDLEQLASLEIKRCLKPENFGDVVIAELHHFADASTIGATPLKPVTVPRLELTAALVSIKVSSQLLEELEISNVVEWFWTDSTVVLGYIANDSRRFHVFVANRLQQIRDYTEPYQWNCISSAENPADMASRGVTADELRKRKEWFRGPNKPSLSDDDPEVKRCQVFGTKVEPMECTSLMDHLERYSDWTHAKRLIANCLKFKSLLRKDACQKGTDAVLCKEQGLPVALLEEAELTIVRLVQKEAFSEELKFLNDIKGYEEVNRKKSVRRTSSLYRLYPFLDENDVLRVGGRLRKGEFTSYVKHPVILPRKSHVTRLIIRHFETANSLDNSSFINALRRFLSIHGPVRQLRSDRGTNFVGAERELRESLEELDDSRLKQFLTADGCDYIHFKMNVPSVSHMGGIWERQIRTVRNVLSSFLFLQNFGAQLDDEAPRTFFFETMAIVNSHPLTILNLHDPFAPEPITPNHLLTMKYKVVLPPPDEFQKPDLYCRKRWRRIQYLTNEFWIQTYTSENGLVLSVKLAIGDSSLDKNGKRNGQPSTLERPVHKLVLLLENETGENPNKEP